MAVKTITIDLEAYERLRRLKDGQSFSQVIKRYIPAPGTTAGDLLSTLEDVSVAEETLDAIEAVVQERSEHPIRPPQW